MPGAKEPGNAGQLVPSASLCPASSPKRKTIEKQGRRKVFEVIYAILLGAHFPSPDVGYAEKRF
jgi:hypothetical protein